MTTQTHIFRKYLLETDYACTNGMGPSYSLLIKTGVKILFELFLSGISNIHFKIS